MTDARLTAEGAETLVTATPESRVSAVGAETLVTATPESRVSAVGAETLVTATPAVRLSTIGVEALCVLSTSPLDIPGIAFIGIYAYWSSAAGGGANDSFTDAVELPWDPDWMGWHLGDYGTPSGYTLTGMTKESGEPDHYGYEGGWSVWFYFTPTSSGLHYIEVGAVTDYEPLVGVYTGSTVDSLTPVTVEHDYLWAYFPPKMYLGQDFDLVADTTYYIAVDGHGGPFDIESIIASAYP